MINWMNLGIFIIFCAAAGWHFVYPVFPKSALAPLFPINESPWEHTKIVFLPAIIFYIIQYFVVGKNYINYFYAHSLALVIMPAVMLIIFYMRKWFFSKKLSCIFNIILTFVSIAVGSATATIITLSETNHSDKTIIALLIVAFIFTIHICFTFFPPKVPLFYDSWNGAYGILEKYNYNSEELDRDYNCREEL